MTLDEYQKEALVTAVFKDEFTDLAHWVLGITGEAGEIAEKVKKIIRDKDPKNLSTEDKEELIKEIGDVLWYLAVLTKHLGYSFDEVGTRNIAKLRNRQSRNVIHGKGDNR